jgi:hypothetical protein
MTILLNLLEKHALKICISALGLGLVVLSIVVASYHTRPGRVSYRNYRQVAIGMRLNDVESLLGSGRKIARDSIPHSPDRSHPLGEVSQPVVKGDVFWEWREALCWIIIGFREDRVCDKWYLDADYP